MVLITPGSWVRAPVWPTFWFFCCCQDNLTQELFSTLNTNWSRQTCVCAFCSSPKFTTSSLCQRLQQLSFCMWLLGIMSQSTYFHASRCQCFSALFHYSCMNNAARRIQFVPDILNCTYSQGLEYTVEDDLWHEYRRIKIVTPYHVSCDRCLKC